MPRQNQIMTHHTWRGAQQENESEQECTEMRSLEEVEEEGEFVRVTSF